MDHAFRTKTGTCTITPEKIILAREGVRGAVAQATIGGSISRPLAIYAALGLASLAWGVWMLVEQDVVSGVLGCALGGFLLWSVVVSRNNSATPVIERTARTLGGGRAEYDKALEAMRAAGLLPA